MILLASGLHAEETPAVVSDSPGSQSPAVAVSSPNSPAAGALESIAPEAPVNEKPKASDSDLEGLISMEKMMFYSDILVSTATKRLQKIAEISNNISIITGREIKEKGALNLKEALKNVAGVEFTYDEVWESTHFRGIHSTWNNKILVLINGRKVNFLDEGNFIYFFSYNLDNVKQIEIVRGPGSALYGANAFAGVINIITKDGKDVDGLDTKVSLGHKNKKDDVQQYYLLTYGKKTGDWDCLGTTGYWRQWGIDPLNNKDENAFYTGDKAEVILKYKDDWTLQTGYQRMESPNVYSSAGKSSEEEELIYLDSQYKLELGPASKASLRLIDMYYPMKRVEFDIYDVKRNSLASPADLPPGAAMIYYIGRPPRPAASAVGGYYLDMNSYTNFMNGTQRRRVESGPMNSFSAELQYDWNWPEENYFIAGLSYAHDWSKQDYFFDPAVFDQNYAFYAQDEYHLWDAVILLAGARYDYNTSYSSNFSPRGSVVVTLLPGLRLKGLYGSAFRSPTFFELYHYSDLGMRYIVGNRDLKPEKIEQSEAIIEYDLGKELQLKGDYFYWETHDEIQYDSSFDSMYVYAPNLRQISPMLPAAPGLFYAPWMNYAPSNVSFSNANSRIGKGFEFEAVARPVDYAKLELNYSRFNIYFRQPSADFSIVGGDADLINGTLSFNYQDLVFLNFSAHVARGPQGVKPKGASRSERTVMSKWLKQYDLSVSGNYMGLGLTVAVYNLFENAVYYDPNNDDYINGPRTIRVNTEYTWNF